MIAKNDRDLALESKEEITYRLPCRIPWTGLGEKRYLSRKVEKLKIFF